MSEFDKLSVQELTGAIAGRGKDLRPEDAITLLDVISEAFPDVGNEVELTKVPLLDMRESVPRPKDSRKAIVTTQTLHQTDIISEPYGLYLLEKHNSANGIRTYGVGYRWAAGMIKGERSCTIITGTSFDEVADEVIRFVNENSVWRVLGFSFSQGTCEDWNSLWYQMGYGIAIHHRAVGEKNVEDFLSQIEEARQTLNRAA